MALEGTKQGSLLLFSRNKWAWNKCGCFAGDSEPNLYTHTHLTIIAAVFADDVGTGFDGAQRAEYLNMRKEYGKLIKIDSPSPNTTIPISTFVGTEWHRDRRAKTIKVTQRRYILKIGARYQGEYYPQRYAVRRFKS